MSSINHTKSFPHMSHLPDYLVGLNVDSGNLVNLRKAIEHFMQRENLWFFSVNLSPNKKYVVDEEWGSLSILKQHQIFKEHLITMDWTEHIPVITKVYGRKGAKLKWYPEKGFYPIFTDGFIFFEVTEKYNLHFHMVIQTEDMLVCSDIKSRLCNVFNIKSKSINAVDFRKITTKDFHEYVFKEGEFKRKRYEVVDWSKMSPLWIHNEVDQETIDLHNLYLLHQEEARELTMANADCPRENTLLN